MRHQVTDGDVSLAVPLESRNERRDTVAQPDLSLFQQDHHARRRRHHFRQRREVEDRVERHRLHGRDQRAVADGLLVERLLTAADEHHRPGQLFLGDGLGDERPDRVELPEVGLGCVLTCGNAGRLTACGGGRLTRLRARGRQQNCEEEEGPELFHPAIIDGGRAATTGAPLLPPCGRRWPAGRIPPTHVGSDRACSPVSRRRCARRPGHRQMPAGAPSSTPRTMESADR